jgi:general secretion pathway protein G
LRRASFGCSQIKRGVLGFSLLELVITLTVLSILTLGVVPLVKMSVRRNREQRLRETLREMRLAIQEFHRDTYGMQCQGTGAGGGGGGANQFAGQANPLAVNQQNAGQAAGADPRSRVVISDCKIFTVDNPDKYPPDLETMVDGVNVVPRGGPGNLIRDSATSGPNATELNAELSTKKKVYLRSIPVDPVTGEAEWDLRSCYDQPDSASWGKENVFDVRSKAQGTALNGEKFSDW